jgi:hypothetical protein
MITTFQCGAGYHLLRRGFQSDIIMIVDRYCKHFSGVRLDHGFFRATHQVSRLQGFRKSTKAGDMVFANLAFQLLDIIR